MQMLSNPEFLKKTTCSRFLKILNERTFPEFPADRVDGKALTKGWLIENGGIKRPIIVEGSREKFKLSVPSGVTKVSDILNELRVVTDGDVPVKLIEVGTQQEIEGYTIGEFAEYLENRTTMHKVLNLISLEISSLPIASKVQQPRVVKSIDWIDKVWPVHRWKAGEHPKVQKYCLTGMAGSYTDFHIDFGGTSVWYHVVTGKKRFFLVAPTVENLKKFQEWTCSATQDSTFFGDLVPNQCFYIDLCAGQTMMIPSAWIHSVYTPVDSFVFGGNFLHSFSIYRQLQANMIEERTRVSRMYRFPYFRQICFYSLCHHLEPVRKLTDHYDQEKLSGLTYPEVFGEGEAVYRQFPYIVKACEIWLNSSTLEDVEIYLGAAGTAGLSSAADVITLWWNILILLAEQEERERVEAVDGETGAGSGVGAGAGAGARIGVVDDILKTKESEFMPDFLSEENYLKALLPSETGLDWESLYRRHMAAGQCRSGCDPVEFGAVKTKTQTQTRSPKDQGQSRSPSPSASMGSGSISTETPAADKAIDVSTEGSQVKAEAVEGEGGSRERCNSLRGPVTTLSSAVNTVQYRSKQKAYKTRGKRLSAAFLRDNTDVDVEERYCQDEGSDGGEEEEERPEENAGEQGEGRSGFSSEVGYDSLHDAWEEEDDEDVLMAKKRKRALQQKARAAASFSASSASTNSFSSKKKPMSVRQNIKQILKRGRR